MSPISRRQLLAAELRLALGVGAVPLFAAAASCSPEQGFGELHRDMEKKLLALYARCRVDVDGKKLLRPCVSPYYNGLWHDDFTWPHLASDELKSSPVLGDALAWLTEKAVHLPVVPDRVEFDGTPVMSPGDRKSPMSESMTLHLPSAWVRLLGHCEAAGVSIPRKQDWAAIVQRSFDQLAFEGGLVWNDPAKRVVAFGFQESIRLTGQVLTTSLVARRGLERAAQIERSIPQLFDERVGGFVGATIDGRAFDAWGNGLAWPYATPAQRAVIARTFRENEARLFLAGCTRQLPGPGGWPGTESAIGHQNGGFWATGTGFVLPMLAEAAPELALRVARELRDRIDGFQTAEWLDASGKPNGPVDLLASLSMPVLGLRAIVERRPLLGYL